jgi:AcrR family transcriptional regulator
VKIVNRSLATALEPLATPHVRDLSPAGRQRNARGHGSQLADDIVSAALAIIERTGSSEAVTLRAVARDVGIAAPSIYAHFADRDAIVMAVVVRIFEDLRVAIEAGVASEGNPVERLVAGCQAYVRFGLSHPARYGVLFSEERIPDALHCTPVQIGPDGRPVLQFGAESFALLVNALETCVERGMSASTHVVTSATAVWVAMHGTVSLGIVLPEFPWPSEEPFVRQLVLALAEIVPERTSSPVAPIVVEELPPSEHTT